MKGVLVKWEVNEGGKKKCHMYVSGWFRVARTEGDWWGFIEIVAPRYPRFFPESKRERRRKKKKRKKFAQWKTRGLKRPSVARAEGTGIYNFFFKHEREEKDSRKLLLSFFFLTTKCTTPSRSDFPCESNPTQSFAREVASCRATTRTMRRGTVSGDRATPVFQPPFALRAYTATRAKALTHCPSTCKNHRRHRPRSFFSMQHRGAPTIVLPPTNPLLTDIFNNNKQVTALASGCGSMHESMSQFDDCENLVSWGFYLLLPFYIDCCQ